MKSSEVTNRAIAAEIAEDLDDIILAAQWLQRQETADYSFADFLNLFFSESLRNVLDSLGRVLRQQGSFDQAEAILQRCYVLEEALGDQHSLRITLNSLGLVFQKQGRLDEAIEAFQQVVEISQTLNDQRQIAIGSNCLKEVLQQQGRV
ncbi:MAG: tetratricopeptide repeat protein [Coleofasciculus sp. D1-CHI-01]|uniref:tetratricopeptide repeat protein n=1 Tax=Coleofasciculus sp. D1-CHI-01 TaxID=3068482 RepID=UPI0033040CAB